MKRSFGLLLLFSLVIFFGCQKETSFETGGSASAGSLQSDVTGDCLPKTVSGAYVAGTALVAATNYIEVEVNILQTGSYFITTDTVNGMYFSAAGVFTSPGLNTVKLSGHGTPVIDGISNFIVSYDSTICSVAVTVLPTGAGGPAVFTLTGAPGACMNAVVSGTYIAGVALTNANTVVISVDVTTIGTYDITTTASNGIIFKGSGTLASTGAQTITLSASGSTPVATGLNEYPRYSREFIL